MATAASTTTRVAGLWPVLRYASKAMTYQDRLVRDPAICGGQPTIRGTRVLLRTILAYLAKGTPIATILAEYPSLTEEDVRAVIAFAARSASEDLPAPNPLPPGLKKSA
jgi:uncharacterized protein (DUF433 family)